MREIPDVFPEIILDRFRSGQHLHSIQFIAFRSLDYLGFANARCKETRAVSLVWTMLAVRIMISHGRFAPGVLADHPLIHSVVGVTITRLAFTPHDTFSDTFTWDDTNMVIISLIESNLTIINAAYPSVRQFLGKVSTGFLVAETAADSRSNSKFSKGNSFALHSIGGGPRGGLRVRDAAGINLERNAFANRSTAGRGDARSDKSFGSEAIMVRRSVEIDERSLDISRGAHDRD